MGSDPRSARSWARRRGAPASSSRSCTPARRGRARTTSRSDTSTPTARTAATRHFARVAVDAGADLVLGSGPHVVRGLQLYRDRLIAYSLGNLTGWHNFGTGGNSALSALLRVDVDRDGALARGSLVVVAARRRRRPARRSGAPRRAARAVAVGRRLRRRQRLELVRRRAALGRHAADAPAGEDDRARAVAAGDGHGDGVYLGGAPGRQPAAARAGEDQRVRLAADEAEAGLVVLDAARPQLETELALERGGRVARPGPTIPISEIPVSSTAANGPLAPFSASPRWAISSTMLPAGSWTYDRARVPEGEVELAVALLAFQQRRALAEPGDRGVEAVAGDEQGEMVERCGRAGAGSEPRAARHASGVSTSARRQSSREAAPVEEPASASISSGAARRVGASRSADP